MRKINILFIIYLFFCSSNLNAQEDFQEKYGFKPKIVTLSNGKYEEFHDNDSIVEIGSALYNIRSGKIIGKLESKLLEALESNPQVISRWMTIDPKAEEYSTWSPYVYAVDNPILFIDNKGENPVNSHFVQSIITWTSIKIETKMQNAGMNSKEKNVARNNLMKAYKIRDNKDIANNFTRNSKLPTDFNDPMHNDEADAVRHAMWSALNTQTTDAEFAKKIGDAHEDGGGNTDEEKEMDKHNNSVGIQIAVDNPDATPQELIGIILDALDSGQLTYIVSQGVTNEDTKEAKQNTKNLYNDGKTSEERLYGTGEE